jgi:hypothetical protein
MTLEDAKIHLRITDTAHDADIQQKLTEAQDVILDYLAEQVNPLWTAADVPPRVLSMIKLYLSLLFDDRDEMTTEERVWTAIRRLAARTRMQAIGVGLAEEAPP